MVTRQTNHYLEIWQQTEDSDQLKCKGLPKTNCWSEACCTSQCQTNSTESVQMAQNINVNHRRQSFSCRCHTHVERSAAARNVWTLSVNFSQTSEDSPLPVLLPLTVCVVPEQWLLSFSDTLIVRVTYLTLTIEAMRWQRPVLLWPRDASPSLRPTTTDRLFLTGRRWDGITAAQTYLK